MDASSASPKVNTDFNVCSFFLQIQNSSYPTTLRPNNTVIKYTKLPDFDFDSKVLWPQKNSYILQPRLRRIVALNDQDNIMRTSRSLKGELGGPMKLMTSTYSKRKIVTISEDEEGDLHPAFSKAEPKKPEIRAAKSPDARSARKEPLRHSAPRPPPPSKTFKKQETIQSAKPIPLNNSSRAVSTPRTYSKTKAGNHDPIPTIQMQDTRSRILKERENIRSNRNLSVRNKTSVSKNVPQPSVSEKEICLIKSKLSEQTKNDTTHLGDHPKSPLPRSPESGRRSTIRDLKAKSKSPVIRVPIDSKKHVTETEIAHLALEPSTNTLHKIDRRIVVEKTSARDICVGTEPEPAKIDVITEVEIESVQKTDSNIQTEYIHNTFYDNLDIPNITLSKDKGDISQDGKSLCSQSWPNLQVPSLKVTDRKEDKDVRAHALNRSASYIIGRATVTYTTKQKIDFHVVDGKENTASDQVSSPLAYPLNIVSVFKNEINKKDVIKPSKQTKIQRKKNKTKSDLMNCLNEIRSLNCSYLFDSSKLVKPSEIISTIRVNSGLLKSDDICEQFQRELDFIDSFFESLQYLESCSLSDKCFANKKVENWVSKSGFDIKNPEYDSLFSKLENGTNMDDTETMASNSLCLLNLLIRDEQRRAKNLLFVLKMREDALKDFTKSQILWLENKKKRDKIDIPTLKKKQRGALLKLQHECGEMQRMRKALLALSEKRKVALMKTKNNIELKLKNNVTVDHVLLGKKKLKRNLVSDRSTAPLKCFELSSSGCEESTASRARSDSAILVPELLSIEANVQTVEKSIQTGDSLVGSLLVDQGTDTAAENYVTVDGGYLNILFNNLSLPEIFSSGKNYEVNEVALKSIVSSANSRHNAASESDIVERFIDQIRNREQDRSTTPSTARSLVDEFDQYYKGLAEEEKSPVHLAEPEVREKRTADATSETCTDACERSSTHSIATFITDVTLKTEDGFGKDTKGVSANAVNSVNTQVMKGKDAIDMGTQAGPLPVPAGAAAPEPPAVSAPPAHAASPAPPAPPTVPLVIGPTPSSSSLSDKSSLVSVSSLATLATPAYSEAEELRRQQLAIEQEIKALEQQQCQLLVVREIPDKPPPPYTPPAESRVLKLPRMFIPDETIEEKVQKNLTDSITVSIEPTDAFDIFLQDFCTESAAKHEAEQSDKPWAACNLLPQKQPLDSIKFVQKTTAEVREVLTGVTPAFVSGVGARRSDHIDDILFAEWRRCEPEWTALHVDEAQVKSQIFEGIFQKILTETIDQYKQTVLNETIAKN